MTSIKKRIGFDLDNTLIDYSGAVKEYCKINKIEPYKDLSSLRLKLKLQDSTDFLWQKAQGWIYTIGLNFAEIASGAPEACQYFSELGCELFIVSHKTQKTPEHTGSVALHEIALEWISGSSLRKYFASTNNIFFEPTREQKVMRVRELMLDVFVDDLEDVLTDSKFPTGTKKILIFQEYSQNPSIICVANFAEIKETLVWT